MAVLSSGMILADNYQILEEIGSGGGGIVYHAKHIRLQTDVVVKKIKDEIRGKVDVRQEADILKKLKHPYLPRVFDFIETEDGVYTVIDYIHGINLDEALKKHGKFSEKQVRKWAEQLGEALSYLHSQNPPIIHSDIKPANIMLTDDGDICLIDFNISLAMGEDAESSVGISAGFSPPEQFRDLLMYAKITKNYTIRRAEVVADARDKQSDLSDDEKTEILLSDEAGAVSAQTDEENLLASNSFEEDKTEILEPIPDNKPKESVSYSISQKVLNNISATDYGRHFGRGIDARSDIYSLGMTLLCLLTNSTPTSDFNRRINLNEMKMLTSEGFALILDKMIHISPEDRYRNGKEFLAAIRDCYKLDARYVRMHRVETLLQTVSIVLFGIGALCALFGIYRTKVDKNVAYYESVENAQELVEQGNFNDAFAILEKLQSDYRDKIAAYTEEVHALYKAGDYSECIRLGEEYINTKPFLVVSVEDNSSYGDLFYIVGNAYYESDDIKMAMECLGKAIEYDSKNALIYRDYAIALAKSGNVDEAKRCLEQAQNLEMSDDFVLFAQGEICAAEGDYLKASTYFAKCIDSTNDEVTRRRAVLLCADMYQSMGELGIDDEISMLEKNTASGEMAGNLPLMERLAGAYARKASYSSQNSSFYYDKALDLYSAIQNSGYVSFRLLENMAILNENMNRLDATGEILTKMLEEYPNRYEVYKRLALYEADCQQNVSIMERDYHEMERYYNEALALYSDSIQDMEMEMLKNLVQEIYDNGLL